MRRCHSTAVQSVRLNSPASQVLSCGADNSLVATDVDSGLMDMFGEGLRSLYKAAGRGSSGSGSDGAGRLKQALGWHLERGIIQVRGCARGVWRGVRWACTGGVLRVRLGVRPRQAGSAEQRAARSHVDRALPPPVAASCADALTRRAQEPSLLQLLLHTAARDGNAWLLKELLQLFSDRGWQPLFGSLEAPVPKGGSGR